MFAHSVYVIQGNAKFLLRTIDLNRTVDCIKIELFISRKIVIYEYREFTEIHIAKDNNSTT